jgi:energy-coupling factor transporter ATP-binding protein EcfA2
MGALMACTMSAGRSVMTARPMPTVAKHSAHPTAACATIRRTLRLPTTTVSPPPFNPTVAPVPAQPEVPNGPLSRVLRRGAGAIEHGAATEPGSQYLRYLARLRGGVDWSFTEGLARRLDLDLEGRIGALSHGNKQKVGIVQAFMHRPELLILDEPTTGLDPLVQREFLALVREARNEGRTVFLSSHILYEVEAVADMVGILRHGRLVVVESVDTLKAQALHRIDLTFAGSVPLLELTSVASVRDVHAVGSTAHLQIEGSTVELFKVAAPHGIAQVVTHEPDLEEIFMAYYGAEQ